MEWASLLFHYGVLGAWLYHTLVENRRLQKEHKAVLQKLIVQNGNIEEALYQIKHCLQHNHK